MAAARICSRETSVKFGGMNVFIYCMLRLLGSGVSTWSLTALKLLCNGKVPE